MRPESVDLGHIVEEVAPPYDDAALSRDFSPSGSRISPPGRFGAPPDGAGDDDFEADTSPPPNWPQRRRRRRVQRLRARQPLREITVGLPRHLRLSPHPTWPKPPLQIGEIATPSLMRSASRIMAKVHGGSIVTRTG